MSSETKATSTNEGENAALVPKLRFREFRGAALQSVRLGEVTEESRRRNGNKHSIASVMGVSKAEGIVPMEARIIAADIERYKIVEHDWFAYNPMRLNIGSIARWKGEGEILVSPDYVVFKCIMADELGLVPGYFDYFRQTKAWEDFVAEGGDGGVRVRIYYKDIARLQLALGSPREQQRIAECLSSLADLIAAQARKVDALKTHKNGLMQQLFPREGETQPRFRFPEFKTAGHWKEKPFGYLLDGIIDFRGRTPAKLGMEWGGGKISSLSANNVKNGFIDYAAECNWGSEGLYQRWMGGVSLQKDDIVFTMEAPLGKALLLPDSEKYILSQRVVAFKTKPAVKNSFLIQLIWSDGFQRAIGELATGSTAKGINQKALKTVLVKLPEPAEQQRIASCLSTLDALITAESQKLEALKTHKKGLMQQLFPAAQEAVA